MLITRLCLYFQLLKHWISQIAGIFMKYEIYRHKPATLCVPFLRHQIQFLERHPTFNTQQNLKAILTPASTQSSGDGRGPRSDLSIC